MKILICDSGEYQFQPFLGAFRDIPYCEAEFLEIGDLNLTFNHDELNPNDLGDADITDYLAGLIKQRILAIRPGIILLEIARFIGEGQAGWGWDFAKMAGYIKELEKDSSARVIVWTVFSKDELARAGFFHPFIEKPCLVPKLCRILKSVISVPNYPESMRGMLNDRLITSVASPEEISLMIDMGNLGALQDLSDNVRAKYISALSGGVPEGLILEAMDSGDYSKVDEASKEIRSRPGPRTGRI